MDCVGNLSTVCVGSILFKNFSSVVVYSLHILIEERELCYVKLGIPDVLFI